MQRPLILGIAGGTGSGKTTIARALHASLPDAAVLIDHDSYYFDQSERPLSEREDVNYDHPETLDNELLADHVERLRENEAIEKPIYDFRTHTRLPVTLRIDPAPVVIVEGILTLAIARLRSLFDIKIFVDTDADIRLMRRIRRDMEQRGRDFASIRHQYYATVRPMHLAFVEPSKRFADVIVPEGGENQIAVDMLVAHVRAFIGGTTPHPGPVLPPD